MKKKDTVKNTITIANNASFPTLRKAKLFKLLLFFAQEVQKNLSEGSIHEMPISLASSVVKLDDLTTDKLGGLIKEMEASKLDWEYYDPNIIGFSHVVSSCTYDKSEKTIRYSFDSQFIREYLDKKTPFKRIPLETVMSFKSMYALKIYELAYQYYDPKRQKGKTPDYTKPRLRNILGVEDTQYENMGEFRRRVINSPIKQVNAQGEYVVSFHSNLKKGKSLRYWFEITPNDQMQFDFKPVENKGEGLKESQEEAQKIDIIRGGKFIEFLGDDYEELKFIPLHRKDRETWVDILLEEVPKISSFGALWVLKYILELPEDRQKEWDLIEDTL